MRMRHVLAVLAAASVARAVPVAGQSLDGHWRSEGYGLYLHISGPTLEIYEVTARSCLPSVMAQRATDGDTTVVAFRTSDRDQTFLLRQGASRDRAILHVNGAASDVTLDRLTSAPATCGEPLANTPIDNFNVFTDTWAEQYGFFDLKKVDWRSVVAANRPRVTEATTPRQLFAMLRDMIEPLHDAHTRIRADSIGEKWKGGRRSASWLELPARPRAFEVVEQRYLRAPLRSWCNGQVQYGRLSKGVAYLRLKSFEDYGPEPGFESGLTALQAALDTIFADAPTWPGLVIDVRINTGGADPYGLAIASRLATNEYVAYAKQARADPNDITRWTDPQPSRVRPSAQPSFRGRVIELIGINSVSAAETFTQALLDRTPKVTRVGENTQGVFSDVLGRRLPNGWRFGLPNERFVTDGKSYDGLGIPPDIMVPVFPKSDLDAGRDGALEKALALLGV